MRTALDWLHRLCAVLAALALVSICLLTLASSIGRALGMVVPSANEMAGYAMAAASFLALAPTLRAGGHIRVQVLLGMLPAGLRRWLELWCIVVTLALVAYLAWWAVDLARQSYVFGDASPGLLAVPLWIPQSLMAFGVVALALGLVEALVDCLLGRTPAHALAEEADSTPAVAAATGE
jgi:TRAP-type C4-dicarboxylate transport system permease small subunit